MYSVIYTSSAKKDIQKLSKETQIRIREALEEIKVNPFDNVKKLKTSNNSSIYSLRVGEHRVIMRVQNNKLLIIIIRVRHRSVVYRGI
jgi:mRNA interferase RelE/StbE